jgi:hypothetical protein
MEMSVRRCSSTLGHGRGEHFMPEVQAVASTYALLSVTMRAAAAAVA